MDLRRLRQTELRRYLFEECVVTSRDIVLPVELGENIDIDQMAEDIRPRYENGVRAFLCKVAGTDMRNTLLQAEQLRAKLESKLGEIFLIGDISQSPEVMPERDIFDLLLIHPEQLQSFDQPTSPLLFPIFEDEGTLKRSLETYSDQIDGCGVRALPFGLELISKISEVYLLPVIALHDEDFAASLTTLCELDSSSDIQQLQKEALTALKRAGAALLVSPLCWNLNKSLTFF